MPFLTEAVAISVSLWDSCMLLIKTEIIYQEQEESRKHKESAF